MFNIVKARVYFFSSVRRINFGAINSSLSLTSKRHFYRLTHLYKPVTTTWTANHMKGKVEKTDPRSADYPLTPTPRTTLRTTPRTTPRTTLNNQPNSFLRDRKIQKAYLLYLKQPPFSFRTSRSRLFHFRPILHRPSFKTLFRQWRTFAIDNNIYQEPITAFTKKQLF